MIKSMKLLIISILYIILVWTFLGTLSEGSEPESFYYQFKLNRFIKKQFDLYNPILNVYKIDKESRKEHPKYYRYDVYYDKEGKIEYSFYRADSYGYLMKFIYGVDQKLMKVILYPVLVNSIDKNEEPILNQYYYYNGKLCVFKDNLNDEIVVINDDGSGVVHKGIIESTEPYSFQKIKISDYYINLLH